MVIGRLVLPMKPQNKIVKFVPKPRVWKLKDEETARLFTREMSARNDVTKADDVQKKWLLRNETWFQSSKQVGGMTKGPHKVNKRRPGGGIEMWKRWLPNERYVTNPVRNLNRLKINIL